jgi:integrase
MPAIADLKPRKVKNEPWRKNQWFVWVPASLSGVGKPQKVYFRTKDEAEGHAELLKARRDRLGTSLKHLNSREIIQAEESFKCLRLADAPFSLVEGIQFAIEHHKARTQSKPFAFVAAEYKKDRVHRLRTSAANVERIDSTTRKFAHLNDIMVCDITSEQIKEVVDKETPSMRNAYLKCVSAFFNLAVKREWLLKNPVQKLELAKLPIREVETVPVADIQKLLDDALVNDLELLPFLVLGFFTGIRPDGELNRLEWKHVRWESKSVLITRKTSKVDRKRDIPLSENAFAWLERYKEEGGSIQGKLVKSSRDTLEEKRQKNRARVRVTDWPNSGMRHCFCSYHLAFYEDQGKLARLTGHTNQQMLYDHYLGEATKTDAEKFWQIFPPRGEEQKIVQGSF